LGMCCEAHLLTKINDYARKAKDQNVIVHLLSDAEKEQRLVPDSPVSSEAKMILVPTCDYCKAKPAYTVMYTPA
jgi:hypothetical protein